MGTVSGLSDQCGPCVLKVVTFACRSHGVSSVLICRGQVNALEFQPKITHQSVQMKFHNPWLPLWTSVAYQQRLAGQEKELKEAPGVFKVYLS